MIAIILCPGPSLPRTLDATTLSSVGRIMCVNQARDVVKWHHWWVSVDAGTGPNPKYVDKRTIVGVCSRIPQLEKMTFLVERMGLKATTYSKIAALQLAFLLGHTRIFIIGDDMAGDTYYDGSKGTNLNETRWENEMRDYVLIASRLSSLGCIVQQWPGVLPNGPGV